MLIGIPAITSFQTIEEQIIYAHNLGLNLLEININYPYCDLETNNLQQIKELSEQYNVKLSLHYDEYADFSSFHDEIREAWIKHFEKTVLLAQKIGVIRITTHLFEGVHVTLPSEIIYVNEVYFEKYYKNLTNTLNHLFDFSKEHGIDLCIENVSMPKFVINTFENLFKDKYHFTYDIGHHYEFGYVAGPIYEKHWDKVKHVHLHDAINNSPHKELGTGVVDILKMMEIAKQYDMDIIIEVKEQKEIEGSVQYLKNHNLL